ncbi:phytoene desaturase [Piscinibacter sp. Jin2]|uniref:Phytoene desaturase n=1 Tax=Aquariibacter lacus TaxID=2801332 RepID=A0A9X0XFZ3_9BURK|nr:1-hydroxycarotenoid 3,4-desaturase CrtD [Piscinibacter lacus]MBL0719278.1 phytoene desaturase [Piscinibacter lacus]
MPAEAPVLVVGAGMGGLSAALMLSARGLPVTVVEAGLAPGGKAGTVTVDGAAVDAGPTVFTLRKVFDAIFEAAGSRLDDHLRLQPLSILARHAWPDGSSFDLLADPAAALDAVAAFAGPAEARRYAAFCTEAEGLLRLLEGPVMQAERPTPWGLIRALGPSGLARLSALGPLSSLASVLGRRLHDPRLRQLFARYATYCGGSPWQAPATLMLVAQVEREGVWQVEGGMHALPRAMEALARARGVQFLYGDAVDRIELHDGRASGVQLASGRRLRGAAVVFNGDVRALAEGRLGEAARLAVPSQPAGRRSLSALVWSARLRTRGFPLVRHNVFFNADYRREFRDIFGAGRAPSQATIYVCAQDRDDRGRPPAGDAPERLQVLVNAPPTGDHAGAWGPQEIQRCAHLTFARLRAAGLETDGPAEALTLRSPADFNRLYPGTGGALYGMATHGWGAIFQRLGANSRVPGLMLAGGSVHPGPGLPMAALSGCRAAEAVMAHLASTRPFRRAATSGGMSMPSATTGATD